MASDQDGRLDDATSGRLAGRCAVLCMEMQRGVVGDLSQVPSAAKAMPPHLVGTLASLLDGARQVGLPVVHCTAAFHPDRNGTYDNVPLINAMLANPEHMAVGTPPVEVLPELFANTDLVSERHHGIAPFTDTGLDTLLRSRAVDTVVVTGVSLNRGVMGMTIEAVNRGYHVVIPRDCVVGYPADYGELVLRHSLAALAVITSAEDVLAAWQPLAASRLTSQPTRMS